MQECRLAGGVGTGPDLCQQRERLLLRAQCRRIHAVGLPEPGRARTGVRPHPCVDPVYCPLYTGIVFCRLGDVGGLQCEHEAVSWDIQLRMRAVLVDCAKSLDKVRVHVGQVNIHVHRWVGRRLDTKSLGHLHVGRGDDGDSRLDHFS